MRGPGVSDLSLPAGRRATSSLIVADDGVGFDAAAPVPAGHHGLGNMRARAEAVGATLRIESASGEGTRIIVELPSRADA